MYDIIIIIITFTVSLFQGPIPGIRPGMGEATPPIQQEKGRGAIGYLMPVYTVGIIILFVYTAMKVRGLSSNNDHLD